MKKWIWIASLLLAMTTAVVFAQGPSLNLPSPPTQPLTVVFKNVTQHDLFQTVIQTLKKSKRVDDLVMFRAERNFIEYHGSYFGDNDALLQTLQNASAGKLNFELKPKSGGGLEILVTPQSA